MRNQLLWGPVPQFDFETTNMNTSKSVLLLLAYLLNGFVYCEIVQSTEESDLSATTSRIPLLILIIFVLLVLAVLLFGVIFKCCRKRNRGYSQVQNLQAVVSIRQEDDTMDDKQAQILHADDTIVKQASIRYKDDSIDDKQAPIRPADDAIDRQASILHPDNTIDHKQAEDITNMKETFVRQLKDTYKDLYDAAQPIPYIKDRLYCYDKVFVECGVEEFVSKGEEEVGNEEWIRMKSCRDIFGNPRTKLSRRILEGEPGYGKSTVTLQFAYDWCLSSPTLTPHDVDILILLPLRHLSGVTTMFKAIKEFLLPIDSAISDSNIRDMMLESKSVVLLLDGFDEYRDTGTTSDIINIITNNIFQDFEVVVTTRSSSLPKRLPPSTKRFRLTGFDDNAQRYYIRKAVVGNDDKHAQQTKRHLQSNPIINYLCQMPLFCTTFSHMAYESEQFRKLNSVTSIFRNMISCFHSYTMNKVKDSDKSQYQTFVIEHSELDKISFEAVSRDSGKILWQREQMCEQIGKEFYEHYVRSGILVEDEVTDNLDDPGTTESEHIKSKTQLVRFYHRIFCEWYAAHYLSDFIDENPNGDLQEFFRHLDPFDCQYIYRFACGLNPNCTKQVVNYLHDVEGGEQFAILCILEQSGRFDQIEHSVRDICSEGVIISRFDSLLLQRSSIQLIDLAAGNGITIEKLILYDCLQSVDVSAAVIRIHGSMVLTSRIPVKCLSIHLCSREMSEKEAISLLTFSSMCSSLIHLSYYGCVPPCSFESCSVLSTLRSRNVKVSWKWYDNEPTYILNLDSGLWENETDGSELKKDDFERMSLKNTEERARWTEERHIGWVEQARAKFGKDAARQNKDDKL